MTGTDRPRRRAAPGVAGLLAAGALWGAWTLPAAAQPRSRLELQFGMGLAGIPADGEHVGASHGAWNVGVAFWLTEHWGVGVRRRRQVGRAFVDPAVFAPEYDEGPSFAVIGVSIAGPTDNETFTHVFVRRRWFPADTEIDLGVSVVKGWSQGYSDLLLPDDTEPWDRVSERRTTLSEWGGLRPVYLDFLVGRQVSRRLGVKAGVTTTQKLRPVNYLVLGVVPFGQHP